MRKGLFIVLEGIDGSGKSSICKRLSEFLSKEGMDVVTTVEPTNDEIGAIIRNGSVKDITQETEALLFVADRSQHTIKIRQWKDEGKIVICDRYYASTLAYQAAPFDGKALDMDWLKRMNQPVITEPDITFLIDVSPEEGLRRVGARGTLSKFERPEYLRAVKQNYLDIANEKGFKIIDANRPLDKVFEEVRSEVYRKIKGEN